MTQPDFLPFALPEISEEEIASVVETLRSGWITTGPKAKLFERRFAEHVGAPHAVVVNSCTAALHLALEAFGIGAGDEVIVPSLTFASSAEVVRYLGARPVLVDVRETDHNVDPAAVEAALTPRTRAVMPVHFAGQPCDLDEVLQVARSRDLRVVEDAAHAFPCEYRGRKIGTVGDITCFSFYATKPITTAEGGAATTASEQWGERMRVMALHGISRDAWKRYTAEGTWYYEIDAPGFKYNLTDVAAALGIGQLARAEQMRARREEIARRYDEAFGAIDALELLRRHPDRGHARHLYVVKLRPGTLRVDRNAFVDQLRARGIGTSVHFIPLHMHPYYRSTYGYVPGSLPVAAAVYERSLSLPIYSRMAESDIARVVDAVVDVVTRNRR